MNWGALMRTVVGLGAVVMLTAACHPKVGTPCEPPGALQCKGGSGAMACVDGIWHEYNCFGPDGCWIDEINYLVICDQALAHHGDECAPPDMRTGDSACSLDEEVDILVCVDEIFELSYTCPDHMVCVLGSVYLQCSQP